MLKVAAHLQGIEKSMTKFSKRPSQRYRLRAVLLILRKFYYIFHFSLQFARNFARSFARSFARIFFWFSATYTYSLNMFKTFAGFKKK